MPGQIPPFGLETTTKKAYETPQVKPNMDVNSLKDLHVHCFQILPFISINENSKDTPYNLQLKAENFSLNGTNIMCAHIIYRKTKLIMDLNI